MAAGVAGVFVADLHLLPGNLHPAISGMSASLIAFVLVGLLRPGATAVITNEAAETAAVAPRG